MKASPSPSVFLGTLYLERTRMLMQVYASISPPRPLYLAPLRREYNMSVAVVSLKGWPLTCKGTGSKYTFKNIFSILTEVVYNMFDMCSVFTKVFYIKIIYFVMMIGCQRSQICVFKKVLAWPF